MSGFRKTVTDLATLFMARVNTKRADVGILDGGVDISNTYEPIGDGTKIANVGFFSAGTDISNYFRDINESLAGDVTVSGEYISDIGAASACTAGVRFNSDGTVDKLVHGTWYQIDASTDWIDPNGDADSTYDVRITNVSWTAGSSFNVSAAAEDIWINLGSNREWSVIDTNSGPAGIQNVSFTVEIRKDDGPVLDSATYTLVANYDTI